AGFVGGVAEMHHVGVVIFFRVVEDGEEAIIVALADRLVLMVVAASAADGQAEKHRAGCRGNVIDFIDAILFVHLVRDGRATAAESQSDDVIGADFVQFVAGELFFDELGVGFVVVEAVNDVIAILVGVGAISVVFETVGVGIASQ